MYFASPSSILCALGPGSLVLILGPAVEVMVCVAIIILVSKVGRVKAPNGTQPVISRPGLEMSRGLVACKEIGTCMGRQHGQKAARADEEVHPASQRSLRRLQGKPGCAARVHDGIIIAENTTDNGYSSLPRSRLRIFRIV